MVIATVQLDTLEQWKQHVIARWDSLKSQVDGYGLGSPYQQLIAIALLPVITLDTEKHKPILTMLRKQGAEGKRCSDLIKKVSKVVESKGVGSALQSVFSKLDNVQSVALDWLVLRTGALEATYNATDSGVKFATELLAALSKQDRQAVPLRVHAELIKAGQNVVFAGRDVNLVTRYFEDEKAALVSYLAEVRADYDVMDIPSIRRKVRHQNHHIHLHQLYTPVDVWADVSEDTINEERLMELRINAIKQDDYDLRKSVIEALALSPLTVVSGSAGTGKSMVARFMATCLAYACDPKAEKEDGVNGLDMLGDAWIHGAVLPIYVNLRQFSTSAEHFPTSLDNARAQHLLNYLHKCHPGFAPQLERFLTSTDVPYHSTILFLDGLDEVYREKDRRIVKKVIENWASRFSKCRILVTTRTYAYKRNVSWRLTSRFKVAELAPYTWNQIRTYINHWYTLAAHLRPSMFGGRDVAVENATLQAKALIDEIIHSQEIWSLARQPLLLALLTMIHEEKRCIPPGKAPLYEETVELLNTWNPPADGDPLAKKLNDLDYKQVRQALQLVAFDMQRDHVLYHKFPAHIGSKKLLERLQHQQIMGNGLGAKLEDVREFLSTRNGILVSGPNATYRFLHLSIQEYLAACALLEQYDECVMGKDVAVPTNDHWTFPENIAALIAQDPYRWRDVALFIGSILAGDIGQDRRWNLIEHLVPEIISDDLEEGDVYSIYVAAEIWSDPYLKARLPSHKSVRKHLIDCVEAITGDNRLDAPERVRINTILIQLRRDAAD